MLRKTFLYLSEQKAASRVIMGTPVSRRMALRFVAGEKLTEAVEAVKVLNRKGASASLDQLGESVTDEAQAKAAADEYIRLLDAIGQHKLNCNASLKLTQMGLDIDPELCFNNMTAILLKAQEQDNFIRIDMEGSPYTQRTLDMFRKLWGNGFHNVGVVLQSYLYRTEDDVTDMNAMGVRVRLCKGAYNEPPELAWPHKSNVDANYVKQAKRLMTEGHYPGLATHDERIIQTLIDFAKEKKIDRTRFEFQMLYGIRRDLQDRLLKAGYNLRIYVPYGKEWYPYFMRRLAERPANLAFFLTSLVRS